MNKKLLTMLLMICLTLCCVITLASCGTHNDAFSLINEYNEYLSVDSDGRTLILSDEPYMWRLVNVGEGDHIVSDADPTLMFDLDNAIYEEGNQIHLFTDTDNPCQYWEFTDHGDGFIITSAENPDWCVISGKRGFTIGKVGSAGPRDTWRFGGGEGSEAEPEEVSDFHESYTPTPEFWEKFDAEGITDEMRAESVHHGSNDAQYLMIDPEIVGDPDQGFDFFSVDFYTENQPDYTYWSLGNWSMDTTAYIEGKGYVEYDTVGAYGGLQDVGDHNTKIMSFWETYFKNEDGSKDTLVAELVYPAGQSKRFDNEGSGTSLVAPFEWKPKTWYRYVLRSWNANDTTYVGSWIEDLSTGDVTLLAVYDTFLPESYILRVPSQFLENFYEDTYGEYRQIQLKNYAVRTVYSQEWMYPDKVTMSVWYDLGYNQGTFRYRVDNDTVIGETCGLGEDACEGLSEDEIIKTYRIKQCDTPPDPDRYEIPSEFR